MAISASANPLAQKETASPAPTRHTGPSPWISVLLTPFALLVHGYHPFAGDAGLYVAGLRHLLDPSLYPLNAGFITAFTRWSVFAWAMAAFIRVTRLPLPWALFSAHLLSLWLFLAACRQLAMRFFKSASARWCALLLAAACCTLPAAGTALVLMDPYVTARSFSTPLGLLAIAACLDRRWLRATLLLALTAAFHPLMAVYTGALVALCALIASRRLRIALALCAAAVAACGAAFGLAYRLPVNPAYRQAVLLAPHSFLFLARWRWYEDLGLALPLLFFVLATRYLRPADPKRALCLTCLLLGATSVVLAAFFVPPAGPYLLVPLQVLRSFHLIYALGVVLAAGPIAALFARSRASAALLFALLFAGMFLAEPLTWTGVARVEWPGARPGNPWQQAFLWIRDHTPRDAVFAFNPKLVYLPEEDEEGFRAISLRDHLADDKDAGVAAVFPALASRWATQRNPELSVDSMYDADRHTVLRPLGATWLLLPPTAPTTFPCPFRNSVAQVCRIARAVSPLIPQKAKAQGINPEPSVLATR
ncbi:MAG TPA: hypothetical protein VHX37_16715 [Acidobacteriaceae bacterium]|jgi:hypothetical protein|nr:hypothetical protein [Acidobacteriaceae bacterium]